MSLICRFENNTAHSLGWFGLWLFEFMFPREGGSCDSDAPPQVLAGQTLLATHHRITLCVLTLSGYSHCCAARFLLFGYLVGGYVCYGFIFFQSLKVTGVVDADVFVMFWAAAFLSIGEDKWRVVCQNPMCLIE